MSYLLVLSWNNSEGILRLPIIPNDGIKLSQPYDSQTYDTLTGQLLLIGHEQLNGFSVSSFFPMKSYNFINPDSGVAYQKKIAVQTPEDTKYYYEGAYKYETTLLEDGLSIVELIQSVNARRIPWRCILMRDGKTIWNRAAAMTEFEWGYDNAGDIEYSMTFTEYRFAERTPDDLATQTAPATAQDVYEVETIITAEESEQEATPAGGTYTPPSTITFERKFTTGQAIQIATSIISGEGFLQETMYMNPSNGFISTEQTSTYTAAITRSTLYQGLCWSMINAADKYYNGDIGAMVKGQINGKQFEWDASKQNKIDNYYGCDVHGLVLNELDRWSGMKCGDTSVSRPLPLDYAGHWFGDSAYKGRPSGADVYHQRLFDADYTAYGKGTYTSTAMSWIQQGKDWRYGLN